MASCTSLIALPYLQDTWTDVAQTSHRPPKCLLAGLPSVASPMMPQRPSRWQRTWLPSSTSWLACCRRGARRPRNGRCAELLCLRLSVHAAGSWWGQVLWGWRTGPRPASCKLQCNPAATPLASPCCAAGRRGQRAGARRGRAARGPRQAAPAGQPGRLRRGPARAADGRGGGRGRCGGGGSGGRGGGGACRWEEEEAVQGPGASGESSAAGQGCQAGQPTGPGAAQPRWAGAQLGLAWLLL